MNIHKANKILIINTFGIGDVLFTTPLVKNLKTLIPEGQIHYLCNRRVEPVLNNDPNIEKVWVYERDEFVQEQKKSPIAFLQKWQNLIENIKKEKFDIVFDLSLNTPMGFLTWAADIPTRIGYNYKKRGRFLTHSFVLKGYEGQHVVQYYLDLLESLGLQVQAEPMMLYVNKDDELWAQQWLINNGFDQNKPLIGLVPGGGASWGTSADAKRWPATKYAQLADKMIEKSQAQIILMGDPKERDLCQSVASQMNHPSIMAAGETSIMQLASLMRRCKFNVVNDGGPLHIAVSSGAKTVSIFGPVDPMVYGPYPKEEHMVITKQLPCQPCYRRFRMSDCEHKNCLTQLTLDEVLGKVESLL